MLFRLLSLVIGYFFGLFQTSYIFGKRHGLDIRTKGSGNAGMTNTMRVFGKKAGALVLICDALKCFLAFYAAYYLLGRGQSDPGVRRNAVFGTGPRRHGRFTAFLYGRALSESRDRRL